MRVTKKHPGAGTSFSEDARREAAGKSAALNLQLGRSTSCVVGDHGAGELCVDVVNRLANVLTKVDVNPYDRNTAIMAAHRLNAGVGVNYKDSDHSGGNTCAALIAGLDDTL